MLLNNKALLKEYILRGLGKPVINIELADEQVYDRIDEAVQYFILNHYDGVEEIFEIIDVVGTGGTIDLPDNIIGVHSIIETHGGSGNAGSLSPETNFGDLNFLIANSGMFRHGAGTAIGGLTGYISTMSQLEDIKRFTRLHYDFEFNKATNRLIVRSDLTGASTIGIVAYKGVDPTNDVGVYQDEWIKRYSMALCERQWGNNLSKYTGTTLPGGQVLNGEVIYQRGEEKVAKLEEEFELRYTEPPLPREA